MKIYDRKIEKNIEDWLFKGKVILLYGARRVGKTTLSKKLNQRYGSSHSYINCDELLVQEKLSTTDPTKLRSFLGSGNFFILDEAQNVPTIGMTLKILADSFPEIQIVATGSSSFDLVNKVGEPLTGRSITFTLYPLSFLEINEAERPERAFSNVWISLIFGSYPEIVETQDLSTKERLLREVVNAYLYKDVLIYEGIKKPRVVMDILKLLALQLGGEVPINEISTKVGVSRATVEKYLDILEKIFVIKSLYPLNRNKRNEISTKRKYYFFDLGVRNAVIDNFNSLETRNDTGALWENYCFIERQKFLENKNSGCGKYFWRNKFGAEIDYIEENGGTVRCFEFKYMKDKAKIPLAFKESYHPVSFEVVNRGNVASFLT